MIEEDIVERGLIAYCIMYFSIYKVNGIIAEEALRQKGDKKMEIKTERDILILLKILFLLKTTANG